MRFLTDQDVYSVSVKLLARLNHDVVTCRSIGLADASDTDLLRAAGDQQRILVTRDRDFGGLVFAQHQGPGVVYLRISPQSQDAVHAELERVLGVYTEGELQRAFIVVEPNRHRIRMLR